MKVEVKQLTTEHYTWLNNVKNLGRSQIFVCGNRARRSHWSEGFLGDLPFPPPSHSGSAPYSPRFTFIGSQDPDVKSHPNIFTHSLTDVAKGVEFEALSQVRKGTFHEFNDLYARLHNILYSRASDVCSLAAAPVLPHTWENEIRFLCPCKCAIGSESSRACLMNSVPIAKVTRFRLPVAKLFCAFPGSKADSCSLAPRLIASTRKAINWCAVFPSASRGKRDWGKDWAHGLCLGHNPAFAWNDLGKPWKAEIRDGRIGNRTRVLPNASLLLPDDGGLWRANGGWLGAAPASESQWNSISELAQSPPPSVGPSSGEGCTGWLDDNQSKEACFVSTPPPGIYSSRETRKDTFNCGKERKELADGRGAGVYQRRESAMAFVNMDPSHPIPSQHSSGAISGNHGWPDRDWNPVPPKCESAELPLRHPAWWPNSRVPLVGEFSWDISPLTPSHAFRHYSIPFSPRFIRVGSQGLEPIPGVYKCSSVQFPRSTRRVTVDDGTCALDYPILPPRHRLPPPSRIGPSPLSSSLRTVATLPGWRCSESRLHLTASRTVIPRCSCSATSDSRHDAVYYANAEKRGSDKRDTATRIKCPIVPKRNCVSSVHGVLKTLNVGAQRLVVRSQRERHTPSSVYGLYIEIGQFREFISGQDRRQTRSRNEGAGETGYPRKNPLTSVIIQHDSHFRNSGSDPPLWEESNHSATETPYNGFTSLSRSDVGAPLAASGRTNCARDETPSFPVSSPLPLTKIRREDAA
ncbi:hypothetical protein PR048_019278 [Dryococelus australis]|uniref:Uncharacterized protein n=1 Tax=Dryococelus australis TaxID=614101 RepID=A0ABQ9H3D7_9NEOP|nr:hypothetical protein PR048_019278 [Dryococelus australis]